LIHFYKRPFSRIVVAVLDQLPEGLDQSKELEQIKRLPRKTKLKRSRHKVERGRASYRTL